MIREAGFFLVRDWICDKLENLEKQWSDWPEISGGAPLRGSGRMGEVPALSAKRFRSYGGLSQILIHFADRRNGADFVTNWNISRTARSIGLKFGTELPSMDSHVWVKFRRDRSSASRVMVVCHKFWTPRSCDKLKISKSSGPIRLKFHVELRSVDPVVWVEFRSDRAVLEL